MLNDIVGNRLEEGSRVLFCHSSGGSEVLHLGTIDNIEIAESNNKLLAYVRIKKDDGKLVNMFPQRADKAYKGAALIRDLQ